MCNDIDITAPTINATPFTLNRLYVYPGFVLMLLTGNVYVYCVLVLLLNVYYY